MMAVRNKHILSQRDVLATLGSTAITALRQRIEGAPSSMPALPSPAVTAKISPRSPALVADYVRHVGGDRSSYKHTVPPHLFPQWGFPLVAKTLEGVPYPLLKVLNGGCRIEINAPLPQGEAFDCRATLESIDDNGRRAVLHQKMVTGTASHPEALVSHLYAIVPIARKKDGDRKNGERKNGAPKREPARVPHVVDELDRWKLRLDAGLDFAKLTGDFNPVHWITPYARMFGFKNRILHGFATMARAYEGLVRKLHSGNANAIRMLDVKFTRPLVLPAKVGLYVDGNQIYVGDAPGGPAYLVGTFDTITDPS